MTTVTATTQEQRLAAYVHDLRLDQIPDDALRLTRLVLLTVAGTAIAGAGEDGVDELRALLRHQGGRPEATVFVYGDKLPAAQAALLNGVMARALDFCDSMAPGLHYGSSIVPAALACCEIAGACSGSDLLTALTIGSEVAARLNLDEAAYNGFDPTGVAGVFGATATAARILGLSTEQTLHALALAFNRCGGSFQSNVDGSLAVRLIQGWVAETGISCALLARAGFTGPANFLDGIYGYGHLFGRDRLHPSDLLADLGSRYALNKVVFKRYPSCGCTQGITELALRMTQAAQLTPADIARIDIRVPPYAYKLVGSDFTPGQNPRVNAQFSLQYCAANAFVRQQSRLAHFRPDDITDPAIRTLIERIHVVSDEALDRRGHTAVDLTVTTQAGQTLFESIDTAPGFPGNPLDDDEHRQRFDDCMRYAKIPLSPQQSRQLCDTIFEIERLPDARALVPLLVAG